MCDPSEKLTAWLDHELPADDAANVERHLEVCAQCRGRVDAYQTVSGALDAYCDACCNAVMESRPGRRLPRWVPVFSSAAAAALFLIALRPRVPQAPIRSAPPARAASAAVAPLTGPVAQIVPGAPAPVNPAPRAERGKGAQPVRRAASRPEPRDANWQPAAPAVEIAIPADAIFPPGAIPAGVSFTADVTIAPDGSAQQIRLRPQLAGFERRTTRP